MTSGTDIIYSPELALQNLADRISQLEHDNAILRASVTYYQGALAEAQQQDANLNGGLTTTVPTHFHEQMTGSH